MLVSVLAGKLKDQNDIPLAPGTLLQLVNLGSDGVFNPINIFDGSNSATTQWVSGDDSLVTASFGGDFPSAQAFDFFDGPDPAPETWEGGVLYRNFEFQENALPIGTKLGIRWFPGLLATTISQNFGSYALQANQPYGEFTRQTNMLHGGDAWVLPPDGSLSAFDALATLDIGGLDPDPPLMFTPQDPTSRGRAMNVVLVPEPTTSLLLVSAFSIAAIRRRPRRSR